MLPELVSAGGLVAVTVTVHAVGLALVVRRLRFSNRAGAAELGVLIWRLIYVAWALLLMHLLEIAVWALFYWWQGCMPDLESAFYFSGVTYATVGYGDLVLPHEWRMLGPIEGLTGGLMVGLSTGFFFAMLGRMYAAQSEAD